MEHKQNGENEATVREVLTRPDESNERSESVASDLTGLLTTTRHTTTLHRTISILGNRAFLTVLWLVLFIGQFAVRIRVLADYTWEAASFPMAGRFASTAVMVLSLIAFTAIASLVGALLIWLGINMIIHQTSNLREFINSSSQLEVAPPRGTDSTVSLLYRSDIDQETDSSRDNRIFIESSQPALAKAVADKYPASRQVDERPVSVLDAADTEHPEPIVEEFDRDKWNDVYGSVDSDRRVVDQLVEKTAELPCPSELQIVVGDGTMTYDIPDPDHSDSTSPPEDLPLFDRIWNMMQRGLRSADITQVWTVNIRIIAFPRTKHEVVNVESSLGAVTPTLGDKQVDGTFSTVSPVSHTAAAGSNETPDETTWTERASEFVGTTPESARGNWWGVIDVVRHRIGRPTTTTKRGLHESVNDRLIRHERHTETVMSDTAPDLLVGAEELPSLLVVSRDATDELEAAFSDDPPRTTPTAEQSNTYISDDVSTQQMPDEPDVETPDDASAQSEQNDDILYYDHDTGDGVDWSNTDEHDE